MPLVLVTKGYHRFYTGVISRGYHQLPRYRDNKCTDSNRVKMSIGLLLAQSQGRQKNPGPKDGTDRSSNYEDSYRNSLVLFVFISSHR